MIEAKGYIIVVYSSFHGYKIGATGYPRRYYKQIARNRWSIMRLDYVIPTDDPDGFKRDLCARFADKRRGGWEGKDWFDLDDSDMAYIRGLGAVPGSVFLEAA